VRPGVKWSPRSRQTRRLAVPDRRRRAGGCPRVGLGRDDLPPASEIDQILAHALAA